MGGTTLPPRRRDAKRACLAADRLDGARRVGHIRAMSLVGLFKCNPKRPSRHGQDDTLAARLWNRTEEIVTSFQDP